MIHDTSTIFFLILRSVLCGNKLSSEEKALVVKSDLQEIMTVAKKHDIAHLIAMGLQNNGIFIDNPRLKKDILTAVYRYEQLNYEFKRVCIVLEKTKIPFIPLKGFVICKYYPKPWMRTSCDVDILVKKADFEKAVSCLKEELGYSYYHDTEHDMSLTSPNGVHIELHFDLLEVGRAGLSNKVLSSVWDNVTPKKEYTYWYEMTDEMFYYYHIAHMAKHFELGGCGIRPLIDLWILENMEGISVEKRDALLKSGGLWRFAEKARLLCRVWMEDKPHDSVTKKMQEYIFHGGNYGNMDNAVVVSQYKNGGKLKYATSRIIIPYDEIKHEYPILRKYPRLTPLMQVKRLFRLVFSGRLKLIMQKLFGNKNASKLHSDDMERLMNEIGL